MSLLLRISAFAAALIAVTSCAHRTEQPIWALAVHGGAGVTPCDAMTQEQRAETEAGMRAAFEVGERILAAGGSALDAVENAVRILEDNPQFNAGRGAAFTSTGAHELDAAIMDGADLRAGAVTGVATTRNPISLARLVMERTDQVMFAGEPADALARLHGLEQVQQSYFSTERRRRMLDDAQQRAREGPLSRLEPASLMGTVGAVALDQHGRLAAATSTGGLTNKPPGRVGDTPIIGGGTYANGLCAVSATGRGEMLMRATVARDVCARMEFAGESLESAAHAVIHERFTTIGGTGGLIAIDAAGQIAAPFNSRGMYRAYRSGDGHRVVEICR